jgi:hypothetical protein
MITKTRYSKSRVVSGLLVPILEILCMWWAFPTLATEPDFYIDFQTCKTTAGYLVLSDQSLNVFEGDTTTMGCSKQGSAVFCSFIFNDGGTRMKGNSEKYQVVLDSPPLLTFMTPNGADVIAVNTTEHAAVIITRILDEKFIASKVCHGLYSTSSEIKEMNKSKK